MSDNVTKTQSILHEESGKDQPSRDMDGTKDDSYRNEENHGQHSVDRIPRSVGDRLGGKFGPLDLFEQCAVVSHCYTVIVIMALVVILSPLPGGGERAV